MFGILISALNTLLGFVFRSLIIKFVVFFALYFVVQGFVEILGLTGAGRRPAAPRGAVNCSGTT
ncbi:hypothetical protein ESCOCP330B_10365 [Escherichia coli]